MGVEVTLFAVFAASMVGTPGPANMVLLTAGGRYGFRASIPFLAGVILGKQIIIWPLGLGLVGVLQAYPAAFVALKYASAAYIVWLAWRIAGSGIVPDQTVSRAPGFVSGLIVHPLNPKAWAMVTGGITNFVADGSAALVATATIAVVLFLTQLVFQPLWCAAGDWLARHVSGTYSERGLMIVLALATVGSVAIVLWSGGEPP